MKTPYVLIADGVGLGAWPCR